MDLAIKKILMDRENVIILVLSLLLCVLLYRLYQVNKDSNTEIIEKEQFQSEKLQVVLFYAPWCGYCKQLMPDWDSLGSSIELEGGRTCDVKKEDCEANKAAPKDYGIKVDGYPHIVLFKNGEAVETYSGPRKTNDIKDWVKKLLGGF